MNYHIVRQQTGSTYRPSIFTGGRKECEKYFKGIISRSKASHFTEDISVGSTVIRVTKLSGTVYVYELEERLI